MNSPGEMPDRIDSLNEHGIRHHGGRPRGHASMTSSPPPRRVRPRPSWGPGGRHGHSTGRTPRRPTRLPNTSSHARGHGHVGACKTFPAPAPASPAGAARTGHPRPGHPPGHPYRSSARGSRERTLKSSLGPQGQRMQAKHSVTMNGGDKGPGGGRSGEFGVSGRLPGRHEPYTKLWRQRGETPGLGPCDEGAWQAGRRAGPAQRPGPRLHRERHRGGTRGHRCVVGRGTARLAPAADMAPAETRGAGAGRPQEVRGGGLQPQCGRCGVGQAPAGGIRSPRALEKGPRGSHHPGARSARVLTHTAGPTSKAWGEGAGWLELGGAPACSPPPGPSLKGDDSSGGGDKSR